MSDAGVEATMKSRESAKSEVYQTPIGRELVGRLSAPPQPNLTTEDLIFLQHNLQWLPESQLLVQAMLSAI